MEIFFLGVGEACDPKYPNTSLLLTSGSKHILLDCGFTTPHLYFQRCSDPEELDALWVSHFHGDHFFGTPLLLLRLWEMNRKNQFRIIGPKGIEQKIIQAMDLAYPNFREKLSYSLVFHEVESGIFFKQAGITWKTAEINHSGPGLSVQISNDEKIVFYSGDGRPTPATLELARGSDLIVHEAFRFNEDTPGHGNICGCIEFAKQAGVKNLALIHLQRDDRAQFDKDIKKLVKDTKDCNIILPEPGDTYHL